MSVDITCEKIDVFLSASNLPRLHTFNNTDPFIVVYLNDKLKGVLQKVSTTEVIRDNVNPHWVAPIVLDYMFEIAQEFIVKVFHYNPSRGSPEQESNHELIGEARFEIGRLMRSSGQTLNLKLSGQHAGDSSVDVRAESQTGTRDLLCVSFSGNKLANKDGFFGKSDPFLVVSRMNEDGSYTVVWKSIKIDNSLNPRWGEAKISMSRLCNQDLDRPLKIEFFDWDSNGKHETMGEVKTSVRSLLNANNAPFDVIEPAVKEKKKNYVNSGTLVAANVHIEHRPTFAEFITGGCEISLVVAIDFTGSNGDPSQSSSLHYIDSTGRTQNQYEEAISCVGRILEHYDSDKKYPVYGFGARVREADGQFSPVQHCLSLGGAEVQGVEGILRVYRGCLPNLMLSGPTLLAPIITTVRNEVRAAGCTQDRQKYTVLLVLTDGTVNDLEETAQAIIEASKEALSVVIIGLGNADFKDMHLLDADKGLLKVGSKVAERDIVQFVEFKDNLTRGMPVVAQQLLAEVPTQLLSFMEKRGITPVRRAGK
eukprot:gene4770-5230_t